MKRYLLIVLWCVTTLALLHAQQGSIDPDNPGDPQPYYQLTVEVSPRSAGAANITTTWLETGKQQYVSLNTLNSNYTFVQWVCGDEVVSTSRSFYYTMPKQNVVLTAQCQYNEPVEPPFDPESPDDPPAVDMPTPKHLVTIDISPVSGGSVSERSFYLEEGASQSVTATANEDYVFTGWQVGDEIVNTDNPLTITMSNQDLAYTALFEYHFTPLNPDSPDDPGAYSFDPFTGRLFIARFKTGKLKDAVSQALGSHSKTEVLSAIILGEMASSDYVFSNGMTNCQTIDLSKTTGCNEIPAGSFSDMNALTEIYLPNHIEAIASYAFQYCGNLATLTFPDSLKTLNQYAFYSCQKLNDIEFTPSLTYIHNNTFYNCQGLYSVVWNAVKVNKIPSNIGSQFRSMTIGDSITQIPPNFCSIQTSTFSLVLGKNVEVISDSAFINSHVESITFNERLNMIGAYAFQRTYLTSLNLPAEILLSEYAFADCTRLRTIDFANIDSLPDYLFSGCTSIDNLTLTDNIRYIGENVFLRCSSLQTIVWDVSRITENPFRNNYNTSANKSYLSDITFGEHISTIPTYFCGTLNGSMFNNLKKVTIGNNVTQIGNNAFVGSPITDIYATSPTPAVADDNAFALSDISACTVHVPCHLNTVYQQAWQQLTNFEGVASTFNYDIVTTTEIPVMYWFGEISIDKEPDCSDLTLQATVSPYEGYRLVQWSNGETSSTISLQLTQDTAIYAILASIKRAYFIDYDSTVLHETDVIADYNEPLDWYMNIPEREGDVMYSYAFRDWRYLEADSETDDLYIMATYDTIANGNSVITNVSVVGSEWNDLTKDHQLWIEGYYGNTNQWRAVVQYAVENTGNWQNLTDTLDSFTQFGEQMTFRFDTACHEHIIMFRTVDANGNINYFDTLRYADIHCSTFSGIQDFTYSGETYMQDNIISDLDRSLYTIGNYRNNTNAGTASFSIMGVFPQSIGTQNCSFTIRPDTLRGSIILDNSSFVFNGHQQTPEWSFSEERFNSLTNNDYYTLWANNTYPGTGTLIVMGQGNYTGSLSAEIQIAKAPVTPDLYELTLPQDSIIFDSMPHGAKAVVRQGVGNPTIIYRDLNADTTSIWKPKYAGDYEVMFCIEEGDWYLKLDTLTVDTFHILRFENEEWNIIQAIYDYLILHEWNKPWDLSGGYAAMNSFEGLTITNAHISGLDLSNSGITGSFPTVVLELQYLTDLNLSGNRLSGNVEDGISDTTYNVLRINISHNEFTGNIGSFASMFPNMVALDASYNHISALSPTLSENLTDLDISHQSIQQVSTIDLTHSIDSATYADILPQIVMYSINDHAYVPVQITMSPTDALWQTSFYANDDYMTWTPQYGRNICRMQQGDTITACVVNGSTFPVRLLFRDGDADMNTTVDVVDLQALINYIAGWWSDYRVFNFSAADLYADQRITIQDMILLIDTLLTTNLPVMPSMLEQRRRETDKTASDATLIWQNGELHLMSSRPVAALDITIQSESEIEWLPLQGQTVRTRGNKGLSHTIIYSLARTMWLQDSDVVIARLKDNSADNPVIIKAVLSDNDAERISVEAGYADIATDIMNITAADCSSCRTIVYDLQGKIVATDAAHIRLLPIGVYMLRTSDNYGNIVDTQKLIITK